MIALFGNLSMLEIVLIAAFSVMIFGRNLPRVAAQLFTHFQRARKALQTVWRESGIGDEIRQVQREMERGAAALREVSPHVVARDALREAETSVRKSGGSAVKAPTESSSEEARNPAPESPSDAGPVSAEATPDTPGEPEAGPDEPSAEASRRPPWYPDAMDDPFQKKPD